MVSTGLEDLEQSFSSQIRNGWNARPVFVPAEFAGMRGRLGVHDVVMTVERSTGRGFESITVASIQTDEGTGRGDAATSTAEAPHDRVSLTVIGLPELGSPLPIIGIDMIALKGTLSLVALDLAPTSTSFWDDVCEKRLFALAEDARDRLVIRKRPEFAHETFSRHAIIAAARPGCEEHAFAIARNFFTLATDVVAAAMGRVGDDPIEARNRNLAWRRSERQNRKEMNALARMFGEDRARTFIDAFLFA
ncbi:MAG: hypothetical protein H7Z43_12885 [Clostridia bacterium]|nr:hypothetical protein [Deltaproteobacteria bacterium]